MKRIHHDALVKSESSNDTYLEKLDNPSHHAIRSPIPRHSLLRRTSTLIAVALIFTTAGYILGTSPIVKIALSRIASDKESLSIFSPDDEASAEVEQRLQSHPLTQRLRQDSQFEASRPHMRIPPSVRPVNLTAGTLLGSRKLVVPPMVFCDPEGKKLISIQYIGSALCGHPGIVHGGLLATLLDEGLARCCFPALPNRIAVTASLKVDYKKPCPSEAFAVLKATTIKVEGRKAWVKGRIESLVDPNGPGEPVVYAEAEALFVEPKFAKVSLPP